MQWTNKNIPYAFNSDIVEWDIKSGNTSIMEYFQLKSKATIDKLNLLDKDQRTYKVGLMQRRNPQLGKDLEAGFTAMTNMFIDENRLIRDDDVISINKDAIFVKNRAITTSIFPPSVNFVPKASYHAYIRLNGISVFIGTKKTDVKGISEDNVPLHKDGILKMLQIATRLGESGNSYGLNEYMSSIADAYKKKELAFDYYREFNASSSFMCNMYGSDLMLRDISEAEISFVDITYNWTKVILPLIQMIC